MKRRGFLAATGTAIATGLAGCSGVTGGNNNNREGSTSKTNISVSISTEAEPSQLPSIWNDQSIEDFQAEFSVETSGGPTQATVSNGKVEINQESEQWNSNTVTVQPGQMQNGEQRFTATAEKNGTQAQDTTTATKPTPGNYKVDVVPERNEELRSTIENNSDEEDYLEARGNFVEQDPVFDTYSSHKAVGFDKLGIDLVAREWHHDNDYESIEGGVETTEFIESIGTDTNRQEIESAKNGGGGSIYPNGSLENRNAGQFNAEEFANANTVGDALDWLHPYLLNYQFTATSEGPISSEDFIYAPVLEQAIEQKNNNDLEVHAWDFDLDEHGNGLIYGKNPDGTDELRIMETISGPVTKQFHPLVEDSNYLNPEHDEFNRYWHPLRFGWEEHSNSTRWNFREEKEKAATVIANMTNSISDSRTAEAIAPTTGYLQDFTEKLRTYNQNDADFEELKNQAKVMDKLIRDEENNHVVYGDTENPQYAVVEDEEIIEDIWEDEEGQYDDFNQFLRDNPSYSMSTEEVDATLEGEQTEDLSQQTLA